MNRGWDDEETIGRRKKQKQAAEEAVSPLGLVEGSMAKEAGPWVSAPGSLGLLSDDLIGTTWAVSRLFFLRRISSSSKSSSNVVVLRSIYRTEINGGGDVGRKEGEPIPGTLVSCEGCRRERMSSPGFCFCGCFLVAPPSILPLALLSSNSASSSSCCSCSCSSSPSWW